MYSYSYDASTGGILLSLAYSDAKFSKEPRPVYADELTLLGFNQYWKYEDQNEVPYMWAEGSSYFYRGQKVATVSGGTFYEKPTIILSQDKDKNIVEPEPERKSLRKIDLAGMVKKNQSVISVLEASTVKKIKTAFEKHNGKRDFFHVAYSGGKDSIVLLDLIKKTLPLHSYIVSFANTGMEFPDTYELIEEIKKDCENKNIPFFTSSSVFSPSKSWDLFGPPSQVLRWCCHVHKSTPQMLLLRSISQKPDYSGLAFVGVRQSESSMRAEYDYESYGTKQQGQYSFNPILEWTSAEVWAYIYANNLQINKAYKRGFARVGCMCCPMGGGRDYYVKQACYPGELEPYLQSIINSDSRSYETQSAALSYLTNGGWNSRKNGLYLKNNPFNYKEEETDNIITIHVKEFKTPWQEWIKTIGEFVQDNNSYVVKFNTDFYSFQIEEDKDNGWNHITWKKFSTANGKEFSKLLRMVFRKSAFCVLCQTCEVNCRFGCISFDNGLQITNCHHCHDCFSIPTGCWNYKSRTLPNSKGTKMDENTSLNSFGDHAPKPKWLKDFFEDPSFDFKENNSLGGPQRPFFKRFVREAGLIDDSKVGVKTPLFDFGKKIGWETNTFFAILLINLAANNPQFRWYIRNLTVGREYSQSELISKLEAISGTRNARSIVGALRRFADNQFGSELQWNTYYKEGKENFYKRTKCVITDPLVVLYALYKFAELNDDHKDFSLDVLMADDEDRAGLSPAAIFGLDRDDLIPILKGLSTNFEDFIYASFTHDLEKIVLRPEKTSADVLELIRSRV